jgi:hypothetical protein
MWNVEKLPHQFKGIYNYTRLKKAIELTAVFDEECHSYQLHANLYTTFFSLG